MLLLTYPILNIRRLWLGVNYLCGKSLGDLNVFPESDIIGEIFVRALECTWHRIWVAPGVVLAPSITLANIELLANTFPWTRVWSRALLQKFLFYARWWKIPIAFDINEICFVRLSDYLIVPNCFHNLNPP